MRDKINKGSYVRITDVEILDYKNREKEKAEIFSIYETVYKNRRKGFNELLNIVNQELKENYSKKELISFAEVLKDINADKSITMRHILYLGIAIDNNDKDKINKYSLNVLIAERRKEKVKEKIIINKTREFVPPHFKSLNQKLEEVNKDLKVILETKRKPKDLYKEEKIVFKSFDDKIREVINEVDIDKFLDYIEIVKGNNSLTKEEISELQEVVEFFYKNLEKSLKYLSGLSVYRDVDEIRRFKVTGEDRLKPMYKASVEKLYDWKITTIKNKLHLYGNFKENLEKLKNGDFESIKQVATRYKDLMKKDEDFLAEDYVKTIEIAKTYQLVNNVKTMNPETRELAMNKLKKRLIR